MPNTIRGIGGAKTLVTDHLRAGFPAYLSLWRTDRGFTTDTLPDPVEYRRNEPPALDRWPFVTISGPRTESLARTQILTDGVIDYRTSYALRLFAWVRNHGWDATIDQRDELVTALRAFLLDYQVLNADQSAYVEETTIVEEMSDVTPVKGDRFVAGGFVAFSVVVDEVVSRPPGGTVASADVDVTRLPHPAME